MSYEVKQVIVVRKDLNMRKGKMCAQVAHASMKFLVDQLENSEFADCSIFKFLSPEEDKWLSTKFAKIVCYVESESDLKNLIDQGIQQGIVVKPIVDSGFTEFHGVPTLTCAAFGPDTREKLDKLTGHLKLL